jgi:hypothetical protein
MVTISGHIYKGVDLPLYFGLGFGGQYLIVVPKVNLTLILTSRIYKDSLVPLNIIKTYLFDHMIDSM